MPRVTRRVLQPMRYHRNGTGRRSGTSLFQSLDATACALWRVWTLQAVAAGMVLGCRALFQHFRMWCRLRGPASGPQRVLSEINDPRVTGRSRLR